MLGLSVVAEGVETQQPHDEISAIGCEFAQGYFYAAPMTAAAISTRLGSLQAVLDQLNLISPDAARASSAHRTPRRAVGRTNVRLRRITATVGPELVARKGVGPDTASTILVSAGDNPHRLSNERTFAALADGTARTGDR